MLHDQRLLKARWTKIVAAACCMLGSIDSPAWAQDATSILRAMSQYVSSQKSLSLTFDTEIEVITPQLQKLQFDSSGTVSISRPDKFRASRTGGYADVELIADGKVVTLLGKNLNVFAQAEIGGPADQVVDQLRDQYSAELPATDLLRTNSFEALMDGVIDAKHIGRGVVDGVECEHLAFRTEDTDWQIWVQVGDRPIPRKYIITSKAVSAAPQYTIRIKDWKTDPRFAADAFTFKPPDGARKIEIGAFRNFDEVPSSVAFQ
ncbi:MAG TPA: DUF2092 domain-containing protein [Afipia sp.]